jgi:hypothetical protein
MSAITAIRQTPDDGLDALLLACPQLPPGPWAHVNALRADGHAELNTLTLPSLRDEAWRFTDLKPLTRMSIKPLRAASPIQAADIAQFELPEAAIRLVFVDGIHAPHLSSSSVDNGGLVVANLPEAMTAGASTVAAHLGRHQAIAGDILHGAQQRLSGRCGRHSRPARPGAHGAGTRAVRRDPGSGREPPALPAGGRTGQQRDADRGLRSPAGCALPEQSADRDRACGGCIGPAHPRAARQAARLSTSAAVRYLSVVRAVTSRSA